jgi:hypothetical protein
MRNIDRGTLFNILTYVVLVATLCLVVSYALVGLNVYNPFAPAASTSVAVSLPTDTPTPTGIATWTPTPTPTITPTPGPTNTPTRTPIPSPVPPTPTFPPTVTPTPRATRAPWPFTCEVDYRTPQYGAWSGVAGHVQDLDDNPLPGYYVVVQGPVPKVNGARMAGENSHFNAVYGNEAAWEQVYNPGAYQAMEIRVQMCKPNPDPSKPCTAISNEVIVQLGGYASASLGYVTCTLNWEEWR